MSSFLENHFGRLTSGGALMREVDGLRFFAIASVLLFHIQEIVLLPRLTAHPSIAQGLDLLFGAGWLGVELFFLISGFILALPYATALILGQKKPPSLGNYYLRRLTRLEPPYMLTMLISFALIPLMRGESWGSYLGSLLASLGYCHNLIFGTSSYLNNNAWSLEIEVQFYVLLPFIAPIFRWQTTERRLCLLAAIALFSVAACLQHPEAPKSLLRYGQYFCIGLLACDLHVCRSLAGLGCSRWFDLGALTAMALLGFLVGIGSHLNLHAVLPVVAPWLLLVVFFSAWHGRFFAWLLSQTLLVIIGGMCYSIYLLHAHVIGLLNRAGLLFSTNGDSAIIASLAIFGNTIICAFFAIAVSAIFFLLIERPCMDRNWPVRLFDHLKNRHHKIPPR